MAEDKIYISRMLNDVIGNVGDMSVSMTQLSEAMAEMQTAIASNVEELKKITNNTADALTEITVEAINGASDLKMKLPNGGMAIKASGSAGNDGAFVPFKLTAKSLASGTIYLFCGESQTTDSGTNLDSQAQTAGKAVIYLNGKSWKFYFGAKIGENIYHTETAHNGSKLSNTFLKIPVNTGDVIELGFWVKLATASESNHSFSVGIPNNWLKIYYRQVHITAENAILPIKDS